ncbi:ABC transporter permease [Pseudoflavonifractor phocaeensis]|uniref:ABC transporter permease n=1 Tax=Pseudoflavonifractor phocaeensis TaxID=1870988 RepID=UPI001958C5BE|nr:ABC transporter permease [Pseudoflavonifractor phocaeensis]MBM6885345.1 ABC transporter permease [Pseudoflavonifractor phocaeensis]
MNLTQAFKIAIKSIAAKKARSALTMLGVIIGLAAVIILVSYAEGQNQQMRAYYESLGSNVININAYSWDSKGIADDLYDYCMELDEYIVGFTPVVQMYNQTVIKYGAKTLDNHNSSWEESPQVVMGNQDFALCNNFTIAKGRDIAYLDVERYNQVCVLGSKIAELLFNYIDPVGRDITINGVPFEVIGVYEEKDPDNMTGMDRYVVLPYTANRVLNKSNQMDTFVAKAKDAQSTKMGVALLQGYLDSLLGQGTGYVGTPNQWQEQGDEQIKLQQRFLGGIAAISLAVGGIGIMNIMLVTVTERTREIGIRKAIGAERKSIIAQFLIEACMICGIGGLFGIAVGYIGTLIVGKASFNLILLPSPGITVGAFLISVALGIGFGLYPAIKASGLQPVDALRAE